MFSGRAAAMASVSLLQLLDEAIGTPEVNVNLEALRKLLKIILGHLGLLGPQEEEGGTGPEAGAWGTGQPGEQLPGKDELQETRRGPPVTSVAADVGQMEMTEAEESGISEVEAFPTPLHAPPKMLPLRCPLLWGLCPYTKVWLKPKL